ncbi:hypothetical protein [Ovoidimarina sediminis]|uniref:hypothetical protein n=1 Tax=Ovoidimarina sediminis TaxID=3079856 RepID=UPI002906B1B7|nr:hypothetical protein [Rhodophyticola sp. MJ-SS7]MDU8945452.1 hypothetical protein [Rhodophyticola sp. MJ-SS7]
MKRLVLLPAAWPGYALAHGGHPKLAQTAHCGYHGSFVVLAALIGAGLLLALLKRSRQ